jgi:glutamate synthase (NADPH/NADH) large chain
VAKRVLDNWEATLPKFVKVMPVEYRRALKEMQAQQSVAAASAVSKGSQKHG